MATSDIRDIMLKSIKGDPAARDEVRDWPREAQDIGPNVNTQIRNWVREELLNRWRNFGMKYTSGTPGQNGDPGVARGQATNYDSLESPRALWAMQDTDTLPEWDSNLYKGPKTAWVRVASNAKNIEEDGRTMKGFIMLGNGNFHDTYGFDRGDGYNGGGGDALTLLGYDQSTPQQEHRIQEPDYKHRPTPGVTSVESEDFLEQGTPTGFRRTTVKFTCWSPTQLDYLQNYFFLPSFSLSVEWGWNTFPRDALLPLDETGIPKRVAISNNDRVDPSDKYTPGAASLHLRNGQGNYGFAQGLITGYDYSIREDGGYDCSIELQCIAEVASYVPDETSKKTKVLSDGRYETFHDYINYHLRWLLKNRNHEKADPAAAGVYARDQDTTGSKAGMGPERTDQDLLKEAQKRARDRMNLFEMKDQRADVSPNDFDFAPDREPTKLHAQDEQAILLTRGRFFIFEPFASSKPYFAGKANTGGSYITVGLLIDLLNIFFAKVTGTNATICEFSCWNSRAVAHPNIKSVDGEVLLIPNSLAPRWNTVTWRADPGDFGSTVGNEKDSSKRSDPYKRLLKGSHGDDRYSSSTSAFLNMINATMQLDSTVSSLEEAMTKSPRDDLHRILAVNAQPGYNLQHPAIAGKIRGSRKDNLIRGGVSSSAEAYETASETIRPFPDFKTFETTDSSDGYSGRISDLFVNIKTVINALGGVVAGRKDNQRPAREILMDIMKQVSSAAGDIWDFQLVGADMNTTSNAVLQLIDANFTGTEPVSSLKKKAWIFPVHRGDSIVRSMDFSIDLANEVVSQVLFTSKDSDGNDNPVDNPNSAFHRTNAKDMLIEGWTGQGYNEPKPGTDALISSRKEYDEMPDAQKYIVALNSKTLNMNTLSARGPAFRPKFTEATQEMAENSDMDNQGLDEWDFFVDMGPGAGGWRYRWWGAHTEEQQQDLIYMALDQDHLREKNGVLFMDPGHGYEYTNEDGTTRPLNKTDIRINPLTGQQQTRKKFGSSNDRAQGANLTHGSELTWRYYTLYADEEFVTEFPNSPLAGYTDQITDDLLEDNDAHDGWTVRSSDQLLRKLHGSTFQWAHNAKNIDHGDIAWDEYIPAGNYEIVNACIPRVSRGGDVAVGKRKGRQGGNDYDHPIVLIIRTTTSALLSRSQMDRLASAEKNGTPWPNDIIKFMSENNISHDERYLTQELEFRSTDVNTRNIKIKKSHYKPDRTHGVVGSNDFEIDVEMVDPNQNRMLDFCRVDSSDKNNMNNNMPLPMSDLTITLDGIEGFRNNDVFNCTGVPTRFYNTGVFRIKNVKHSINEGDWQTTIDSSFCHHRDFNASMITGKGMGSAYISKKKDLTIDAGKQSRTLL